MLLGLSAGACSSIPEVTFPAGSRVEVRLYDAEQGIQLALANETHPGLQDVYSEQRKNADLKLAPDQLIGQLLASLERAGFDRHATRGGSGPSTGARAIGAPGGTASKTLGAALPSSLHVLRDGVWSEWLEPQDSADREARTAFGQCKLIMNEYYSHVGGLQFVANPEGHSRLRDQEVEVDVEVDA
ncbi:MAG: hypothetical protein DHS20C15_18810 [Planctomycetota bacterium]|nr:MAG: hypothetical protein DHS20C15_18810 [Planctomycetota bacterium]